VLNVDAEETPTLSFYKKADSVDTTIHKRRLPSLKHVFGTAKTFEFYQNKTFENEMGSEYKKIS